jgi:hypothetical protein
LNVFGSRYIEALSFAHYLERGTLVPYDEVQLSLSDENGIPVRMLVRTIIGWLNFALYDYSSAQP